VQQQDTPWACQSTDSIHTHSHATWFLSNGGSVRDLQAQLGHAALSTTEIYAAAVNERRRSTVLAMDFRPEGKQRKASKRPA
jgi:site-specific recombinase XerD